MFSKTGACVEYSTGEQVAQILVRYSTRVERNDRVLIVMREVESFELARSVAREAQRHGARVQTLFSSALMQADLLREGAEEQVGWVPELWRFAMEWADVCIDLRGFRNPHEFQGVASGRIALLRKAEGEISALRTAKTRWSLVRVPTEALAQQAGMAFDALEQMFYRSVLQDWEQEAVEYRTLQEQLEGSNEVRIVGEGTDLRFSTAGRSYVVDDGRINMPGGEVFTAPLDESVNGIISFEHPGVFAGVFIEAIRLEFRDGVVVDASAGTNEEFLSDLLDMDAGARRVGEFGIGTNRHIDVITNDILYDEKILGTIHIALGRSYAECGGVNQSSLHWDIVKDLRSGGTIYFDGVERFKNGSWLSSDLV